MLLLLSEVQEDNWTAFERWKARSVYGHPGTAQGAAQRTVSGMQEGPLPPGTDRMAQARRLTQVGIRCGELARQGRPPPDPKSGGNIPGEPLEEATDEEATTGEATGEEASQPTPKPPPELEAEEEVKGAAGSFPRDKRQRAPTPPKLETERRGSRGDTPKRSTGSKARGKPPKSATPTRAPGGQRNYVKIVPGGKVDREVQELADSIRLRGKSVRSRKQYSSGERHWRHLREQMGWPPYVTGLSPQTIAEQAVYFAAAEVKLYGLGPGSLHSKFSAIRWMHDRD